MGALTSTTWSGEAAVKAIEAGADIILLPINTKLAINSILEAVSSGRISVNRINESYKRIMDAKKSMGLLAGYNNNWIDVENNVGVNNHKKIARDIARKLSFLKLSYFELSYFSSIFDRRLIKHSLLILESSYILKFNIITLVINYNQSLTKLFKMSS